MGNYPIPLHGSLARRLDDEGSCPVDAEGRPIALKLTERQTHDGRSAADMFEAVQAGQILLADRAHDSDALREALLKRDAWANISSCRRCMLSERQGEDHSHIDGNPATATMMRHNLVCS